MKPRRTFDYRPGPTPDFHAIFGVHKARKTKPEADDFAGRPGNNGDEFARFGDDADIDADNGDDASDLGHLSKVVTAMKIAHPNMSDADVMAYILHHPEGRALVKELFKRYGGQRPTKERPTMDTIEQSVAKCGGIVDVAKALVAGGPMLHGLTPNAFTEEVTKLAEREHPQLRRDAAFAKVFAAQDDRGVLLRKAWDISKGLATLVPTFVGGNTTTMSEAEAIAKLRALAEKQHRTFESVLVDPANVELATAAHRRPQATTSFAFPV